MKNGATRETVSRQLCLSALCVSWCLLASLACDDVQQARPDAGESADARGARDGMTELDAAPAKDAGRAGSEPSDAASLAVSDAGRADAARADANFAESGSDAGASGGASSLRSQICGAATSFPPPLPSEMSKRRAEPVGNVSFGFLEGPVWIASQGVLLFSDMNFGGGDAMGPPSRIRRLKPPAAFDEFSSSANSNGLALDVDGALLAATHDKQALSRFSLDDGARTQLDVRADGKRFNSPNDLAVRSDGTVYLTDPDWQLGSRTSETKMTGLYRVRAPLDVSGNNAAELVDGTLTKPNGVALSPDEQTLYVGSQGSEIWKYPVMRDGTLGVRSKFADTGSSDGMGVDCAGNLYVTSGTVEVFAASGMKLGDISVDGSPSNVAFGGDDHKTLYITAGPKLYAIPLNVPGLPY